MADHLVSRGTFPSQSAGLVDAILPAAEIVRQIVEDYAKAIAAMPQLEPLAASDGTHKSED